MNALAATEAVGMSDLNELMEGYKREGISPGVRRAAVLPG